MPVLVNLEFTRGTHVSSELFMLIMYKKWRDMRRRTASTGNRLNTSLWKHLKGERLAASAAYRFYINKDYDACSIIHGLDVCHV